MKPSDKIQKIHERALQVSSTHRKSEVELISLLQEMDNCRGYLHFDANSLFDYAHRILQLSEATSSNLINVARKSVEVPALKEAIETGVLSVSKARKIVTVLTHENQKDWIALASQNTTREIERAVAKENPELAVRESARFVSEDRLELKLGCSEVNYKNLKRVSDLESQRTSKAVNHESAIAAALEAYLEKYDPIRVAERSAKRNQRASSGAGEGPDASTKSALAESVSGSGMSVGSELELVVGATSAPVVVSYLVVDSLPSSPSPQSDAQRVTGHTRVSSRNRVEPVSSTNRSSAPAAGKHSTSKGTRPSLPRALVHQIHLRDGGQCTYQSSQGMRCTNRRWLEFHHVIPRELGGTDNLENLTTLCSIHHNGIHQTRSAVQNGI